MTNITTPRVRLSLYEFLDLFGGLCTVIGTILKILFYTSPPWHAIHHVLSPLTPRPQGSERKRESREYWRKICTALIRAGGDRFSIRQLQYMMPNTTQMVRVWSRIRRMKLKSEVVPTSLLPGVGVDVTARSPAPVVHWIGGSPSESGLQGHERVLLYVHGGGFVLPMSHGHFELLCYIRKRLNSELRCTVYIAAVEYSIAPYSRHPVQLVQVLQSLSYLLERYHIPPASLILAGDSCGAALCISTLSHVLHPHPSISIPRSSTLRNLLPSPLAGVLLLSPWTSFATTSASFRDNSSCDSLTPSMIRRYRDTFINGTPLLPATSEADAWSCASERSDSSAPTDVEEDPVLLEPLVRWNGDKQRGYWLRPTDAPLDWWAGIEGVTSKVMTTAGIFECFRDDVLSFEAKLRLLMRPDRSGPALEVSSFLDCAVHATLVNDFAFGIEPSEQMDCVTNWLMRAFQPQE